MSISHQNIAKHISTFLIKISRLIAWGTVAVLIAFLFNNYFTHWLDWPGASAIYDQGELSGADIGLSLLQNLLYGILILAVIIYIFLKKHNSLYLESQRLYALTTYLVRTAFWAVFLIGIIDFSISFLRVENLLSVIFGDTLADNLIHRSFRCVYVHLPLILIASVLAAIKKDIGFPWLALLIVIAELTIVISGSIYSYEQAMFGDLVRFWYAALFLFASAYTLLNEGHVRVDLFYASISKTKQSIVNAIGSIFLGMSFCWVILFYGMYNKHSIINAPILSFEGTQQEYGMQVKYWMAAFLAVFAVTMLIQFSGYFLECISIIRGEEENPKLKNDSINEELI